MLVGAVLELFVLVGFVGLDDEADDVDEAVMHGLSVWDDVGCGAVRSLVGAVGFVVEAVVGAAVGLVVGGVVRGEIGVIGTVVAGTVGVGVAVGVGVVVAGGPSGQSVERSSPTTIGSVAVSLNC